MSCAGGRFTLHALLFGSVIGVVLSAAWVAFWVGLTFEPAGLSPEQVRQEILSATIGCALLVIAAAVFYVLRLELWLIVITFVLTVFLVLGIGLWVTSTGQGSSTADGDPASEVLQMWVMTPTTWPMLVFLVLTALAGLLGRVPDSTGGEDPVTGGSRPGPRSRRGR